MNTFFSQYKWHLTFTLVFLSLIAIVLFMSKDASEQIKVAEQVQEIPEPTYDVYGIEEGIYEIQTGQIGRGETLSHILGRQGMEFVVIDHIVNEMKEVFDPRRIRAGNRYQAYLSKNEEDSIAQLQYFTYDINPLSFVLLDLTDSLTISREEKEVEHRQKTASGIIESSLWVTLTRNDLHPELAIRMSEVLAWEVDFYRIHAGDRFKVVYDEKYVGEELIGIGNIEALYFSHQNREVYGFHFAKDTVEGYFNKTGDNLRKVFLKAPIKFGRISSGYSRNRLHPILGVNRPHLGTDYAAPEGTPIYAVGDGVITHAHYTSGNGNFVRIRHNSVYETQYLHMSRFGKGIKPGTRVNQGDVIGYVGMTGLATGPHVCFRFWKNGQQVNHLREEFPSADPLHEDFHDHFFQIRDGWLQVLQKIEFPEDEEMVIAKTEASAK